MAGEGHLSPESPLSVASGSSSASTNVPLYSSQPDAVIFEISSSIPTASAFTESLSLSCSRSSSFIAAYSSSALYVLRTAQLPVGRAFRIPRKPTAVAISDPGHVLAILWTPHKLELYNLYNGEGVVERSRHISLVKSLSLPWKTSTIVFDPANKLLACGNEQGIELIPVTATGNPQRRRQLACRPLSHVAFSDDSRTLLATNNVRMAEPTTLISVRTEEEGAIMEDDDADVPRLDVHQAWMDKINFSQTFGKVRQATFGPKLPDGGDDLLSLFAYDAETKRFGIYDLTKEKFTGHRIRVRVDKNEVEPYPAGWYHQTLPVVNDDDTHVALVRNCRIQPQGNAHGTELCVYRLPDTWRHDIFPRTYSRDVFVEPFLRLCLHDTDSEINDLVSVSRCQWLTTSRLVLLMNSSAQSEKNNSDPAVDPAAACGQICILRLLQTGATPALGKWPDPAVPERMPICLDDHLQLEDFPEVQFEFEQEVAIQRSRTIAQRQQQSFVHPRRSGYGGVAGVPVRALSTLSSSSSRRSSIHDNLERRRSSETSEIIPIEEPYVQGQPRPTYTLQRAATVAAASPAARRHLATLPNQPLEYRRADGRRELPHESDADDPRPPPPPYTRYPDMPGPGAVSLAISPAMETHFMAGPAQPAAPQPMMDHRRMVSASALPLFNLPLPNQSVPALVPPRQPSRLAVPQPGALNTSLTFPGGRRPSHPISAIPYAPGHSSNQSFYGYSANVSTVTLPERGSNGLYYPAPRARSRSSNVERPERGQSRLSMRDKAWYKCVVM